jgi:hypothetical protein
MKQPHLPYMDPHTTFGRSVNVQSSSVSEPGKNCACLKVYDNEEMPQIIRENFCTRLLRLSFD